MPRPLKTENRMPSGAREARVMAVLGCLALTHRSGCYLMLSALVGATVL